MWAKNTLLQYFHYYENTVRIKSHIVILAETSICTIVATDRMTLADFQYSGKNNILSCTVQEKYECIMNMVPGADAFIITMTTPPSSKTVDSPCLCTREIQNFRHFLSTVCLRSSTGTHTHVIRKDHSVPLA